MIIDQNRLVRQKVGLGKWRDNKFIGTLMWCTGVGKTFAGILAIKYVRQVFSSDGLIIVTVPTDNLRTQWREKLESLNLTHNVLVDTVHSLLNKQNLEEAELFILDEVHGYTGGEKFSTIFDRVKHKRILGLTAQEREQPEDQAILQKYAPIVDTISVSNALENGWIAPFIVYNLGLEFNEKDRNRYDTLNKSFHKYFSTFGHDFKVAMACLKDASLRERIAVDLGYDSKIVSAHAFQFNKVMQKRKKYLYNADSVLVAAIQIAHKFNDKKIITFSETTDMADNLTMNIDNSIAYHSNLETILVDGKKFGKKRRMEKALVDFKNDEYRVLNTARALNMGQDIPSIDMSIKTSYNSTVIDATQRLGRTLRVQKDKVATEVNLYLKQTQTEKWLRNSQRKMPNVIWIDSIDEIVV